MSVWESRLDHHPERPIICMCVYIYIYICIYIYIYNTIINMLTPQLTRTTSKCVSPLSESTVGKVLSVQHQPSTFVVADLSNIHVPH